ncbi:hypothetical protein HDV01_002727 [Terramyces sp. JEL0728]|nr:hypothetical protein HDV01_002727 [Terramyces sp. JEL0728]
MQEIPPMSETEFKPERKIFIPIDKSDRSEQVIRWAKENLIKPTDLVILFHVYKDIASEIAMIGSGAYADAIKELEEQHEKAAFQFVKTFAAVINVGHIHVKGVIIPGNPKKAIDEQLRIEQPDLIVIGKRRLGKVEQVFMGSISNHIIHNSVVPVIVVPPQ